MKPFAPSLLVLALVTACGDSSTVPGDAKTDASTDGASPSHDASAGDAHAGDSGSPQTDGAIDTGTTPAGCTTASDCRAYANDCDGCTCLALAADAVDPVCNGSPVSCLVDPCQGKKAVCEGGSCVIRAQ